MRSRYGAMHGTTDAGMPAYQGMPDGGKMLLGIKIRAERAYQGRRP